MYRNHFDLFNRFKNVAWYKDIINIANIKIHLVYSSEIIVEVWFKISLLTTYISKSLLLLKKIQYSMCIMLLEFLRYLLWFRNGSRFRDGVRYVLNCIYTIADNSNAIARSATISKRQELSQNSKRVLYINSCHFSKD